MSIFGRIFGDFASISLQIPVGEPQILRGRSDFGRVQSHFVPVLEYLFDSAHAPHMGVVLDMYKNTKTD